MGNKIPAWVRNKYLIAVVVVLAWLLFFDNHNFVRQWRIRRELRELRLERNFYLEEISRDSTAINKLTSDPEALERYAREQYLMKRTGEDVFIVIED